MSGWFAHLLISLRLRLYVVVALASVVAVAAVAGSTWGWVAVVRPALERTPDGEPPPCSFHLPWDGPTMDCAAQNFWLRISNSGNVNPLLRVEDALSISVISVLGPHTGVGEVDAAIDSIVAELPTASASQRDEVRTALLRHVADMADNAELVRATTLSFDVASEILRAAGPAGRLPRASLGQASGFLGVAVGRVEKGRAGDLAVELFSYVVLD